MYRVGQRWFSVAEPELGLGIIKEVQGKKLEIEYPAVKERRTYGKESAPLKRLIFGIGDKLETEDNKSYIIEAIQEENGVLFYLANNTVIPEMMVKSNQSFTLPHDKIFKGTTDDNNLFNFRYDTHLKLREYELFKNKGLLGSKVSLPPHQAYITNVVTNMVKPRVMLADEVGLGKTIEAGLIIKSLILKNRISKTLIVTPEPLVYQWWVEMIKKFNLRFHMMTFEKDSEFEAEALNEGEYYIIGLKRLLKDIKLKEEVLKENWDMLVVDEAHQLIYTENNISEEYKLIETLSKKTPGLILLSATPEILGPLSHFSRMRLIDSDKFNSFENYQKIKEETKALIPLLKDLQKGVKEEEKLKKYLTPSEINSYNSNEIIEALIDRFGTGRIYLRNTRENIDPNNELFPKRKLHPHPISLGTNPSEKIVFQKKIMELLNIINTTSEKILVICHSKDESNNIFKNLTLHTSAKLSQFHSGMSILERDRQSAYFADPEGARVLIATEVGSEGRNFEFASHLVLFDLPRLPEQLEQRIGRLDRIGQKNIVNIHVPYLKASKEEVFFRWYNEVFNSFLSTPKGSSEFYQINREELLSFENDLTQLDSFLVLKTKEYKEHSQKLKESEDILVSLNSFNKKVATEVIKDVSDFSKNIDLKEYLFTAFDLIGVDVEELNEWSYFIKPSDSMKILAYPGLTSDGLSFSFDREMALKRDDIAFMSMEHPIALGTLDISLSGGVGSATIASSNGKIKTPHFEFIFTLRITEHSKTNLSEFLSTTPLRVVLDHAGVDQTKNLPKKKIDEFLTDASHVEKETLTNLPKDTFTSLLKKASEIAEVRSKKYKEMSLENLKSTYTKEINRLKKLKESNPLITSSDIKSVEEYLELGILKIDETKVSFDSIRVIIP